MHGRQFTSVVLQISTEAHHTVAPDPPPSCPADRADGRAAKLLLHVSTGQLCPKTWPLAFFRVFFSSSKSTAERQKAASEVLSDPSAAEPSVCLLPINQPTPQAILPLNADLYV